MYPFVYHRPDSVSAARAIMGEADDGRYLAGGQTILPSMKLRLAGPSDLIDLAGVAELGGIQEDGEVLTIGALTRHDDVAAQDAIPSLAALAGLIGDPAVRNRGTIGGSLANNDPAADYPAAVFGLNATVVTDTREIAADDFFVDIFETALEDDEILTAVRFPKPVRAAYAKMPHPGSRFALVGVMVAETGGAIRVAVTGAAACVFRVPEMEAALSADFDPGAVADIAVEREDFNEDIHASAEYRAHLVTVMAKRAVEAARGS